MIYIHAYVSAQHDALLYTLNTALALTLYPLPQWDYLYVILQWHKFMKYVAEQNTGPRHGRRECVHGKASCRQQTIRPEHPVNPLAVQLQTI